MKKFMRILFAALFCLTLAASFQGAEAARREDVNIYVEGVIPTLDPYGTGQYVAWYVFNQVYETLTTVDDSGKVQPCLATGWEASQDGLKYTFKLVKGAKFHNGETFTAEDVAYSLNTASTKPAVSSYTNMIDRAEAVDENTVTVYLKRPYAAFASNVSELPIVNKKFYSEHENLYNIACGTGAYRLVEADPNSEIKLTRFDEYRQGPAKIRDITFKIITDSTTASIAFETGELDFLMVYNVSNFPPLRDSGKYNAQLCATFHTAYIELNNELKPFDNKLVRQALTYAVDRETIIQVAYDGMAVPARMNVSENSFGADFSDAMTFEFSPEKAKKLLAEAGYPDGIDFTAMGFEFDYISGSYHEKIAQCIQQTWAECGVRINLRASENVSTNAAKGNYAVCTMGNSFTGDMSYTATMYASSAINASNHARYSNPRVDELYKLGDATTNSADRLKYYKEICNTVIEDCPYISIQHKQIPYVWVKDLNAVPHLSSGHPWYVYEWSWN
ncbi:MAG: ABC transporter substrate-binding protein [Synergistaceae bacterium]|jgi:peptide/nickel transport system substrate-binding protein|nr:ABC transporter substrate-binding protein [Synergistaceae bacterium]